MTDQIEQIMMSSKQARLHGDGIDSGEFFSTTMEWLDVPTEDVPAYQADSRKLDIFLSRFWKLEPHLAGILMGAVSIDMNRGWRLTGGRNQVLRYSKVLHNWIGYADLFGWRVGTSLAATSFYSTNLGAIIEVSREVITRQMLDLLPLDRIASLRKVKQANGNGMVVGPMRGMFHVDPTKCRLSGDPRKPLKRYPKNQNMQQWAVSDYMRITSMPRIEDEYFGLGNCAIYRCLILAQLMIAVYAHDKEMLGAQAPRGLLLLSKIKQKQFEDAMRARKTKLKEEGWRYFSSIAVLANNTQDIDAKLLALSQLPKDFDMEVFTSLLIYGYSLCFGYDPIEFYPVRYAGLSRSTEADLQHNKASGKGQKNFVFTLQDQLSRSDMLPDTVLFEVDERDDEAEISAANVVKAWVDAYRSAYEAGGHIEGMAGLTREEYRVLLARKGIIDADWTAETEPSTATDTVGNPEMYNRIRNRNRRRDELMSKAQVVRAAMLMPQEPILQYSWPHEQIRFLWPSGEDLLRRVSYPSAMHKIRQDEEEILYSEGDVVITEQDAERAIRVAQERTPEFGLMMEPLEWPEDADAET